MKIGGLGGKRTEEGVENKDKITFFFQDRALKSFSNFKLASHFFCTV